MLNEKLYMNEVLWYYFVGAYDLYCCRLVGFAYFTSTEAETIV